MIVLINPNLVVQKNDPFTTGIVYMPITLAYTAAHLVRNQIPVHVIDAFAEKPKQGRTAGNFVLLGLSPDEVISRIRPDTQAVYLYAINLNNHLSLLEILGCIKKNYPQIPVAVIENTQSVTGFSLNKISQKLYKAGADFIITGEAEERSCKLARALMDHQNPEAIDGIGGKEFYHPPLGPISDLDGLSFPAWDLFPLQNYWDLKFSHGPLSADKYLPLLTSRGCPYPCRFCVIPSTNQLKWRTRSAQNVVDEIEYFHKKFGISEFHIEDLDPTVQDQRTREICREILKRNLKITWKISAGTKAETIKDADTLDMMAKAGCRYISISPETGSERLLKTMNKPFQLDHALNLIKDMNRLGIFSQACFVLGFPGETEEDRQQTLQLVRGLAKNGVDEVALFIVTPVPGSAIYEEFEKCRNLWDLTFSPVWRSDYKLLNQWRLKMYQIFIFQKLMSYPGKILRQCLNFFRRRFDTKMEMVPYRALIWALIFPRAKKIEKLPVSNVELPTLI